MRRNRYLLLGIALFGVLTVAAGPAQTTVRKLIQVGSLGETLTEQEIADIQKVLPNGGVPWLISADGPGPFDGPTRTTQYVYAYMSPVVTLPGLRRGSVMTVTRRSKPAITPWAAYGSPGEYAQVAIEGRDFDQIQGENDSNLPFRISGISSEAELISVVRFVRASYAGPISGVTMNADQVLKDVSEAFRNALKLEPGNVMVGIRLTPTSGLSLTVHKQEQTWSVVSQMRVNE